MSEATKRLDALMAGSRPPHDGYRYWTIWGYHVERLVTPPDQPVVYGVFDPAKKLIARSRSWQRATQYALTLRDTHTANKEQAHA